MAKVTYIAFDGSARTVDVAPGFSVMEGAKKNGIAGIDADCGVRCRCGGTGRQIAGSGGTALLAGPGLVPDRRNYSFNQIAREDAPSTRGAAAGRDDRPGERRRPGGDGCLLLPCAGLAPWVWQQGQG